MAVFICHSSRDDAAVRTLVQHLQAARESVWLDQSLSGGEAWWSRILDHIRSCSVFVVALSNHSLQSKPCRAEMDYAKALGLPILPVQIGEVDSYRIDPIFTMQSVDYRNPDVTTGLALIAALHERAAERKDLPEPLPEPPPIPYEYLQRFGVRIDSPEELSPTEQSTIVQQLRRALHDEDEDSVREDIRRLLRALRRRSEVTHAVATEIDSLVRAEPTPVPPIVGPTAPVPPKPTVPADSAARARVLLAARIVLGLIALGAAFGGFKWSGNPQAGLFLMAGSGMVLLYLLIDTHRRVQRRRDLRGETQSG